MRNRSLIKIPNILLVDDDPLNVQALARTLGGAGFATTRALDGVEALECLETETFDAVVSDVLMPRMNGLQLVRRIRRRFPDLPVILMSGLISDEVCDAIAGLGAAALFQKPVSRAALILLLRSLPREPGRPCCEFYWSESEPEEAYSLSA